MLPLAALGQTRVTMPKNKYKVQDDVKIGREASRRSNRQMPILNDAEATRYVASRAQTGRGNSVAVSAAGFQLSSFKIVNASDINAFALPGGPMYVNRGMIEAANNEGEMAGVMAHEIAHVALRHGTAQATKQSNPLNQILDHRRNSGRRDFRRANRRAQLGQIGCAALYYDITVANMKHKPTFSERRLWQMPVTTRSIWRICFEPSNSNAAAAAHPNF